MRVLIFLGLFIYSSMVFSVCYHNGVQYQTGAVVGQYICTASGSWQRL